MEKVRVRDFQITAFGVAKIFHAVEYLTDTIKPEWCTFGTYGTPEEAAFVVEAINEGQIVPVNIQKEKKNVDGEKTMKQLLRQAQDECEDIMTKAANDFLAKTGFEVDSISGVMHQHDKVTRMAIKFRTF